MKKQTKLIADLFVYLFVFLLCTSISALARICLNRLYCSFLVPRLFIELAKNRRPIGSLTFQPSDKKNDRRSLEQEEI